jgi:hypothetical protein
MIFMHSFCSSEVRTSLHIPKYASSTVTYLLSPNSKVTKYTVHFHFGRHFGMFALASPRPARLRLLVFVVPVSVVVVSIFVPASVPAVGRAARFAGRGLTLATRPSAGAVACSAHDRGDLGAADAADALITRAKATKADAEAADDALAEAALHNEASADEDEATVVDAGELSDEEIPHFPPDLTPHHGHTVPHSKRADVRMAQPKGPEFWEHGR